MYTGLNVISASAHWACDTVRLLKQATPLSSNQICGHRTAQTQFGLLQDMGCRPAASLSVADAYRWQTEAALAERLALVKPLRHWRRTIHTLVHVCGRMWTVEQYYDSITILSAILAH